MIKKSLFCYQFSLFTYLSRWGMSKSALAVQKHILLASLQPFPQLRRHRKKSEGNGKEPMDSIWPPSKYAHAFSPPSILWEIHATVRAILEIFVISLPRVPEATMSQQKGRKSGFLPRFCRERSVFTALPGYPFTQRSNASRDIQRHTPS